MGKPVEPTVAGAGAKEGAKSSMYLKIAAAIAVAGVAYQAATKHTPPPQTALAFPSSVSTRIEWDGEGDGIGIAGGIGDISAAGLNPLGVHSEHLWRIQLEAKV